MEKNKYIKFEGELSKENKKILTQEVFMVSIPIGIISNLPISIIIIIISLQYNILYLTFLFIPITLFIGVLLTPFVTLEVTKEVLIQDGIMYITYGKFDTSRDILDVKEVIDYGEGYYFKFYFPHKCYYCFCQKDLIKEGTISDFEELFKDKIIRKA